MTKKLNKYINKTIILKEIDKEIGEKGLGIHGHLAPFLLENTKSENCGPP